MENEKKETTAVAEVKPETAIAPTSGNNAKGELTMWNDAQMLKDAWQRAQLLAKTDLVPDTFRQKPENVLIALDVANRTGTSPLMVMQNLYVVKGKPTWSGQMCISLVNGCGRFTPLEFCFVGEMGTDSFGCYAKATRIENGKECCSDVITIEMAKKEGWYGKDGSKWKTMPSQMMMYRAGAFFARANCPDILMGMQTVEEVEDVTGKVQKKTSSIKDAIDAM